MQTHRSGSKRVSKPLAEKDKSSSSSSLSSLKKMSKTHRPSLSGPMNWLGRSSSSASNVAPYAPSKPIRISEPQMKSAFESMAANRSGPLGAGATVVRTPQEALAGPLLETRPFVEEVESDHELEQQSEYDDEDVDASSLCSRAHSHSPPLPPIPDDDEEETPRTATAPRPTRPAPPAPIEDMEEQSPTSTYAPSTLNTSPKRPALKVLDSFPPVPALPANLPASPPQLPFEPVLLSSPPSGNVDPAKVIVSLETSTTTHKTTMKTLMSRCSLLSTYLQSLLPPPNSAMEPETPGSRLSEADESFRAIFQQHLASSGLLLPGSTTLHIFLDRPSAPYVHILAYLRTPLSSPEHPATLPRAVQLLSSSSTRLEALLELRDEARYLELDELYKLCTDELRSRQNLGQTRSSMHSRAMSSASASTGSDRSFGLGPLREVDDKPEEEQVQPRSKERRKRRSGDSGNASSTSAAGASPRNSVVAEVGWHSPVPGLAQRSRSPRKYASLRTQPTGDWI